MNSWTKRHSETSKYIFINRSVIKNWLNNLKVHGGKTTMISFLGIRLLSVSIIPLPPTRRHSVVKTLSISINYCNDTLLPPPPKKKITSQNIHDEKASYTCVSCNTGKFFLTAHNELLTWKYLTEWTVTNCHSQTKWMILKLFNNTFPTA
jgi:hypothetical protein